MMSRMEEDGAQFASLHGRTAKIDLKKRTLAVRLSCLPLATRRTTTLGEKARCTLALPV